MRTLIVDRVQRCVDAEEMEGDATDIAHGLVALIQGLAEAEISKRLGTTRASVDRRWELAIGSMLAGLRPGAIRPPDRHAIGPPGATPAGPTAGPTHAGRRARPCVRAPVRGSVGGIA